MVIYMAGSHEMQFKVPSFITKKTSWLTFEISNNNTSSGIPYSFLQVILASSSPTDSFQPWQRSSS